MITRQESIVFKFECPHDTDTRKLFGFERIPVQPGDKLKATYSFYVNYMGEVTERFEALTKMMNDGVIVTAEMDCLNQTDILFVRFVTAYNELRARMNHGR